MNLFVVFLFFFFKKICGFDRIFNFLLQKVKISTKKLIMAVVENAGFNVDNSLSRTESLVQTELDQSKSNTNGAGNTLFRSTDRNNHLSNGGSVAEQKSSVKELSHHINGGDGGPHQMNNGGNDLRMNNNHDDDDGGEGFKKEMRDLEEMLSKLNPMAKEFVPPSFVNNYGPILQNSAPHFGFIADGNFLVHTNSPVAAGGNSARRVWRKS